MLTAELLHWGNDKSEIYSNRKPAWQLIELADNKVVKDLLAMFLANSTFIMAKISGENDVEYLDRIPKSVFDLELYIYSISKSLSDIGYFRSLIESTQPIDFDLSMIEDGTLFMNSQNFHAKLGSMTPQNLRNTISFLAKNIISSTVDRQFTLPFDISFFCSLLMYTYTQTNNFNLILRILDGEKLDWFES